MGFFKAFPRVPRKPSSPYGRKVKIHVTIDPTLHAWIRKNIGPGKDFTSLSHAVERAVALLRQSRK